MRIEPLPLFIPRDLASGALSSFFEAAKYEIRQNMERDIYHAPLPPAIYVYRITTAYSSHIGLIALNDLADFWEGKIKKHEKTLTRREEEYVTLLREWRAVIKPVLLTYPVNPTITNWLIHFAASHSPLFDYRIDQVSERHELWAIESPDDQAVIQALFNDQVARVYIADGHHRTTTIANLSLRSAEENGDLDFSRLFCAYFSEDQLQILGYHRLLALPEGVSNAELLQRISDFFEVEALDAPRFPTAKREIIVLFGALSYRITPKEAGDFWVLDAHLLNEYVFARSLGIADVRSASCIRYVEGSRPIDGLVGLLERADQVLFLLHPVAFDDLFYLSDQGLDLPPKSTWFEPRIKSGLTVHSLAKSINS